ncbi:MBOAT family O-acyltransferase [Nafulsella turpanensis]|uniref:MBOAT family O-acyltransferase n=1 Tax=Nafulsella turpanensis TaxID=1265690 RepID=UPI001F424C7A|nr:MBOAT family protein [Nafulsella turpanensis]
MVFNFFVGKQLSKKGTGRNRKGILIAGIVANVLLLVFFKYTDFLIQNFNALTSSSLSLLHIVLPLGISFFTFQQIAYLVDSYHGHTADYRFLNYGLFVSFFPQLIAGPIVHHSEMMPQFYSEENMHFRYDNLSKGIFMFFMGLCKKVILADSFALFANYGYSSPEQLSFLDSWITSISYACQLYYDFSGYTDMAIGAALMFNIQIPQNFNSPYHAKDIQDFWRRWHITLSRFLRDYIYIPLGGSRSGEYKTLRNLMITFLIGGLWHGAGWTFIFWGFLHGFALIVHRLWTKYSPYRMGNFLGVFITFNFVNIAWVFFRAEEWSDAINILQAMFGFGEGEPFSISIITDVYVIPIALIGIVLLFMKNTHQRLKEFAFDTKHLALTVSLIILGLLFVNSITANDFLYFDF